MENQQQIENACSDEMEISLYDIFMAVLSINFIGDGLRDAMDAKQKK